MPRYRFLQRVKCNYEMAWNHPKHEFYTEIVDWACSLRQNKKWFRRHKLVHLMHDSNFHNGSGAAMKWRESTRNTSFRHKVCGAKPTGRFRAPKWCANTQNVSFEPKGVH